MSPRGRDLVPSAFAQTDPVLLGAVADAMAVLLGADPLAQAAEVEASIAGVDAQDRVRTRAVVSDLRRVRPPAVAAAPVLAAWAVRCAPTSGSTGDAGEEYAAGEVLYGLAELRTALEADQGKGPDGEVAAEVVAARRCLAAFLDAEFRPVAVRWLSAPMRRWHRGLVAYLRAGPGVGLDPEVAVRYLEGLRESDLPESDRSWFGNARDEVVRLVEESRVVPAVEAAGPGPVVAAVDESIFYAGLLVAPSAEQRAWGIREWAEHGGPVEALLPLLDDDGPLVRDHAAGQVVVEVRAVALVALQDRHRADGGPWTHGPVRVRRAMPVAEASRAASEALAGLSEPDRLALEARLARAVTRLDPPAGHRGACLAYLTLQSLGRIGYEVQEVSPDSLLTPLQREIIAGQMVSPRPYPQVRFFAPDGRTVGYLYRSLGQWVLDLDESSEAAAVARRLREGERSGELPRPPADDDAVSDYLWQVAGYVAVASPAEVVRCADGVMARLLRRRRAEVERGEFAFRFAGRRFTARWAPGTKAQASGFLPGRLVELEPVLRVRPGGRDRLLRLAGPAPAPKGRLVAAGWALYRVDAPLAGVLRRAHDGQRAVDVYLDVGWGQPVRLVGVTPEEAEGLQVGDRVRFVAALFVSPVTPRRSARP